MNYLFGLEEIESYNGTRPNEPYAIAMRQWQQNLEQGMSFSDATRGWLPPEETLLVTSADIANLIVALESIDKVVDGVERIKRAMRNAITYPLFLLALTFLIIVMVGIYLVPPLIEVVGKVRQGFEMLVDNFSLGIIGMLLAIVGYLFIGGVVSWLVEAASAGVNFLLAQKLFQFNLNNWQSID